MSESEWKCTIDGKDEYVPNFKKDNITAKLTSLGLETKGNKREVLDRLCGYLNGLKLRQLKEISPDDLCRNSKAVLIKQMITTNLGLGRSQDQNPDKCRKSPPKKLRQDVWDKWIGVECGSTLCPCCQTTKIKQGGSDWDVSHVIPDCDGGAKTIDNLRPVCRGCNASMAQTNMQEYCESHYPNSLKTLGLSDKAKLPEPEVPTKTPPVPFRPGKIITHKSPTTNSYTKCVEALTDKFSSEIIKEILIMISPHDRNSFVEKRTIDGSKDILCVKGTYSFVIVAHLKTIEVTLIECQPHQI